MAGSLGISQGSPKMKGKVTSPESQAELLKKQMEQRRIASTASRDGGSSSYGDLFNTALSTEGGAGTLALGRMGGKNLDQQFAEALSAPGPMIGRGSYGRSDSPQGPSGLGGLGQIDGYGRENERYKERAEFDAALANRAMKDQSAIAYGEKEREMQMKMELLQKLLGLSGNIGRGGRTVTNDSTTNDMEYVNIAGRPVAMPKTSSTSSTQREKGMNPEALLQMLLGAL